MSVSLNHTELHTFCEQFSLILHAGISPVEGLQLLADDSPSPETAKILNEIREDLELTGSLAGAMEKTGLFPASMTACIRTGEETGCLDEIMSSLALHYEREISIRERIRSAAAYPLLMMVMMGAVIVILLAKVLPIFSQVFHQMGMEMTGISKGLLSAGTLLSRYSILFLILLVLLTLFILYVCVTRRGRALLLSMVSRIPYLKEIPVAMDYARFAQGMAMGIHAGLGGEISMELSVRMIEHPVVTARAVKALELLKSGSAFTDATRESGLFTGMDSRLIHIGSQTGSTDEIMQKIADRYQEESLRTIDHMIGIVEPTIVILLSVLVGIVLLSVMLPLLGILSEMVL